jgi:hypothetical protein
MKHSRGSEPIEKIDDLLGHLQAEVKILLRGAAIRLSLVIIDLRQSRKDGGRQTITIHNNGETARKNISAVSPLVSILVSSRSLAWTLV